MYTNKVEILKNALSPYDNYCDGYGNIGASGNSYILGLAIGVGVVDTSFSHQGSHLLDEITAFDLAETEGPFIGQLNMSIVSSFCGPQGLIWGFDIARNPDLYKKSKNSIFNKTIKYKDQSIKLYEANPIINATKSLFGTVNQKKFILRPGAHVPFAGKNKIIRGKDTVYAAVAIGIPENRQENACLLMEDIGIMQTSEFITDERTIFHNLAKSIIQIGINQHVKYSECFAALKSCKVKDNQIGCALVAAPYFTLARKALIKGNDGNFDFEKMVHCSLSEWEKCVKH